MVAVNEQKIARKHGISRFENSRGEQTVNQYREFLETEASCLWSSIREAVENFPEKTRIISKLVLNEKSPPRVFFTSRVIFFFLKIYINLF